MNSALSSGSLGTMDLQEEDINLLLFGCDFFPVRKASEINFWNDMVDIFAHRFKTVVVLSVNNRQVPEENLRRNVVLYNVPPHYLGNTMKWKDPEYTGSRFHKLPLSTIYKTYTLLHYLPMFERLIKKHQINVVHYMRIFGLLNSQLTQRYPEMLFSITVPTHIDRGFPLHRFYHTIKNLGLQSMDKIVPTSRATMNRLEELGIEGEKLSVVPWSLKVVESQGFEDVAIRLKNQLHFESQDRIVLWSGPLQHTGSSEFYYALEIARRTTSQSKEFVFVFAFKPDKLKEEYREAATDIENIRILETDRHQFIALRKSADLFLSPICNLNRTVAPPLTWIEMMRCHVPVITTNIPGVDEIIEHGENGFIVSGSEDASKLLLALDKQAIRLAGEKSAAYIDEHYNQNIIADQYADLWRTALHQKQQTALGFRNM